MSNTCRKLAEMRQTLKSSSVNFKICTEFIDKELDKTECTSLWIGKYMCFFFFKPLSLNRPWHHLHTNGHFKTYHPAFFINWVPRFFSVIFKNLMTDLINNNSLRSRKILLKTLFTLNFNNIRNKIIKSRLDWRVYSCANSACVAVNTQHAQKSDLYTEFSYIANSISNPLPCYSVNGF